MVCELAPMRCFLLYTTYWLRCTYIDYIVLVSLRVANMSCNHTTSHSIPS